MYVKFTTVYSTLPSIFAQRSHNALTTAASAKWMTPFSGPSWIKSEEVLNDLDDTM